MMSLFSLNQVSLEPARKNLTNSKRTWTAEYVMGLSKSAHLLGKYSTACPQALIREDPNSYSMKYKGRAEVTRNFPLMTLK